SSTAIVEESINNIPGSAAANNPLEYASKTCFPAGNIVITTSAPFTASSAVSAGVTPCSAATLIDACTTSKPVTLYPASTRFRAMWEPIFPRPRKAIFIPCPYVLDGEILDAVYGAEERLYSGIGDINQPRRVPLRVSVFINDLGSNALCKVDPFHSV